MASLSYRVRPSEPCLLAEVFLPKKAVFQGPLYRTLTRGLRLQAVRDHFLRADATKRQRLNAFLLGDQPAAGPAYADEEVRAFRRILYGYSLYEVDGVYLKGGPGAGEADDDDRYQIEEERTQVIRFIFKYPCADKPAEVINACKAVLRDAAPVTTFEPFAARARGTGAARDGSAEIREALADLAEWTRQVGLFLFGYVVFTICEEIVGVATVRQAQQPPSEIRQDEIWVCTQWDLNLSVVREVQQGG